MTRAPSSPRRLGMDFAGVASLVALSLLGWQVVVRPLLQTEASDPALTLDRAEKERAVRQRETQLAEARARLETARREVGDRSVSLSPASELNGRLALLGELAQKSDVLLDQLKTEDPVDTDRFSIVRLDFAGAASYPAFSSLLHRVHVAFPDSIVESFQLQDSARPGAAVPSYSAALYWHARPRTLAHKDSESDEP